MASARAKFKCINWRNTMNRACLAVTVRASCWQRVRASFARSTRHGPVRAQYRAFNAGEARNIFHSARSMFYAYPGHIPSRTFLQLRQLLRLYTGFAAFLRSPKHVARAARPQAVAWACAVAVAVCIQFLLRFTLFCAVTLSWHALSTQAPKPNQMKRVLGRS